MMTNTDDFQRAFAKLQADESIAKPTDQFGRMLAERDTKIETLTAQLAARDAQIVALREALRELVACKDADPIREWDVPGYRWYDAWDAARRALSAQEKG